MYLVEILLPLYDNGGRRFGAGEFDRVRDELAARFGGVTAFRRAPAEGVWREGGEESRDRVVIFEVMDRMNRIRRFEISNLKFFTLLPILSIPVNFFLMVGSSFGALAAAEDRRARHDRERRRDGRVRRRK